MKEITKMKKANKLINLYSIIVCLFTAAAVTLRTVAQFLDYNDITTHFNNKTLFTISAWLIVGEIVLVATFFMTAREKIDLASTSHTPLTYVPSGLLAVALVFMGFNSLTYIREFSSPGFSVLRYLSIAISLSAFIAAAFFVFIVLNPKRESLYKSILSISVVVFLTLYAAFIYFNRQNHPTNSPVKIIDQMAYLFSSIFFVYETRIALGRALWKPYIVFGLIASSLCAYSAIPSIIVYVVNGSILSLTITESALTLTLFIFAISRVWLTTKLPDMNRCKAATLIVNYTESREEELSKLRMFHAAANAPMTVTAEDDQQPEKEASQYGDDNPDVNQETINIDEYTVKQESSDETAEENEK